MTAFPYPVPEPVLASIERSERVLLGTHENPDADGLGSLVATGLALLERGRHVAMVAIDEVPGTLGELTGLDRIPRLGDDTSAHDLALIFDCHRRERLGPGHERLEQAERVIAIDHHPLDPRGSDCDALWLVEDAPATTMMIHSLLRELHDVPLGADKASCLYAGLLTDTGGFRHANTTHDALLAAADLVGHGADPAAIADTMLHRRRPEALRLLGEALLATEYRLDGRVALMVIDEDLLARTGATLAETEGLVSYLTSVEGVEVAVMLKQDDGGRWRVSLRSQSAIRVDRIARDFGGGGHHRAAAFSADHTPREELEAGLLDRIGAVAGGRAQET